MAEATAAVSSVPAWKRSPSMAETVTRPRRRSCARASSIASASPRARVEVELRTLAGSRSAPGSKRWTVPGAAPDLTASMSMTGREAAVPEPRRGAQSRRVVAAGSAAHADDKSVLTSARHRASGSASRRRCRVCGRCGIPASAVFPASDPGSHAGSRNGRVRSAAAPAAPRAPAAAARPQSARPHVRRATRRAGGWSSPGSGRRAPAPHPR